VITISISPENPKQIMVQIEGTLQNLRGLNAVLADRYVDVLRAHFRRKNSVPNGMGAPKTNFWNQIADATGVTSVTDEKAVVTVAEDRFAIHLFGGTIKPKKAKALTIPIIPEARGLFASSYEKKFGRKLFSIPGRNVLFERSNQGTESVVDKTNVKVRGKTRSLTIPLKARSTIRPVYALRASVTLPKDEDALPPIVDVVGELQEEADDFFARELRKGRATK